MFHTMRSGCGRLMTVACRRAIGCGCAVALAGVLAGGSIANAAIFDDFSDLNDTTNPTWTHINGTVASTGQTWDASTGQYRLIAPNNGFVFGANGALGYVASHTGPSFTNVRVSADFVQPATGRAFGVAGRLNGNNAFNALSGYGYAYEPFAAGGLGEMVLMRMTGGNLQDIGSQQVTLDLVNKDYTFILDIIGTQLHGRVYEIGGGLVAEKFATDANYISGTSGVWGWSSSAAVVPTDFTIDNFEARVPEPATGLLLACGAAAMYLSRRRR